MTEVVIPMPDGRSMVLDLAEYQRALERGRELVPQENVASATPTTDEVMDASGMETRTGVPASWWLEAARRGDVPHLKIGKYVRFRVATALESLEARK